MYTLTLLFSIFLEILAKIIRHEKEISKNIQLDKDKVKLQWFGVEITQHREESDSARRLLQVLSEFIEVARYKISE